MYPIVKYDVLLLALPKEAVLRERLFIIVAPRSEIGVRVRFVIAGQPRKTEGRLKISFGSQLNNSRIDVFRGRVVLRVTAIADGVRVLIHADPIHP